MTKPTIETNIPVRLDRLPWSRFHWLVVVTLGITWILDGLEVTLVGSLAGAITQRSSLGLTDTEIGAAASCYLAGAILGAIGFGYLADRLGRKRLFTITLAVYAAATVATGCSWDFLSFAAFRFATGAGIGGEYSAINSAIQELIPARYRGWTDLSINGSFWLGAAIGAGGSIVVLDPALIPTAYGWRIAFAIGGILGVVIIFLRHLVPESPRWLMTHGRIQEAEDIAKEIEDRVGQRHGPLAEVPKDATISLRAKYRLTIPDVARTVVLHYPRRMILGLALMAAQAFFYNAVFFTYALVLTRFYGTPAHEVGRYILAFAAGNFIGPLVLGRLFDSLGRRVMITATYGLSGLLMTVTAILFARGALDAVSQTALWTAIFFVASAAASSAYLTVSETFPLEMRAMVIALFYAVGTAIGGIAGPATFGALIDTGSRQSLMWGYLTGAGLMIGAAIVEAFLGVAAERQSLESIAPPLSSFGESDDETGYRLGAEVTAEGAEADGAGQRS